MIWQPKFPRRAEISIEEIQDWVERIFLQIKYLPMKELNSSFIQSVNTNTEGIWSIVQNNGVGTNKQLNALQNMSYALKEYNVTN